MIYESEYFIYKQNLTIKNFEYINKYRYDFIPKLQAFLKNAGITSTFIDSTDEGMQAINLFDNEHVIKYGFPEWLSNINPTKLYSYSRYTCALSVTTILLFTINDFQFALLSNSISSDPRYNYTITGAVSCELRVKYVGTDSTIESDEFKNKVYSVYLGRLGDEWNTSPQLDVTSSLFYPWGGGGCRFRLLLKDNAFLLQGTTILNAGEKGNRERHLFEFGCETLGNGEKIILPTANLKSKLTNTNKTKDSLSPMYTYDSYAKFHDNVGDRFLGKIPMYEIGVGEEKYGYISNMQNIYQLRNDSNLPYGIVSVDSNMFMRVRLGGCSDNPIFSESNIYLMRG